MRIGIVCYPTFGGSGVLATELGKALAQKGHHGTFYYVPAAGKAEWIYPQYFLSRSAGAYLSLV